MARPRKELVSPEITPFYHISSRCVRRTFLCGYDETTQTSYEHRRQWIEERIRLLSSVFTVDICSYAVMSNHYHLVVRLSPEQAQAWSEADVLQRWLTLYKGPILIQRFAAGENLSSTERDSVSEILSVYRERLCDLSWFMKCLNEPIARRANREDNCTGHFWESRFSSDSLHQEEALLSAMVYVDLNPIRSCLAKTPETSEYTSVKERIQPAFDLKEAITSAIQDSEINNFTLPLKPLLAFDEMITHKTQSGIPFCFNDYLELLDWTGRAVRADKRGHIPGNLPPILSRLQIEPKTWLQNSTQFEARYRKRFNQLRRRRSTA